MTALKDMCQAIRTTITVKRTAAATAKYRPRAAASRLSRIGRICKPMKMKASTFSVKITVSQTAYRRDAESRGDALGRRPRHGNRVAHHGEHTGQTDPVGQYPDPEGADELKNDRGRHVTHTVGQPQHEPPERRADNHAADHSEQEGWRNRSDGEPVGGDGSDSEAINQQRAGVIQKTLAFEDCQQAMRRSQVAEHGRCRRGVGWCDDGAQRNRRRPRHGGHQRARHHGDGDSREAHGDNDQTRDRCPVVPEVSRRCVIRRVEQYGCHEQRQRELGQHGERRCAWHEREDRAAERKEHRIGCAHAPRHRGQQRGGEDQDNEDFEFSHLTGLAAILDEKR